MTDPNRELFERLVTPVYFIATKLDAFHGRGEADLLTSHDLEDIIALVDGRDELLGEIKRSPPDVRTYFTSETRQLLDDVLFVESLPGFLGPDAASQARRPLLEARLRSIVITM